jgi:hypothetical protein
VTGNGLAALVRRRLRFFYKKQRSLRKVASLLKETV